MARGKGFLKNGYSIKNVGMLIKPLSSQLITGFLSRLLIGLYNIQQ